MKGNGMKKMMTGGARNSTEGAAAKRGMSSEVFNKGGMVSKYSSGGVTKLARGGKVKNCK